MAVLPDDPEFHKFMYAFGEFIITWNHVELAARDIVIGLVGSSTEATIVGYHLGNTTLTDVMRVASKWNPDGKDHLAHFATLMDTIRAYRNYYVHNLLGLGKSDQSEPVGLIMAVEVRGKYRLTEKALLLSELNEVCHFCETARVYGLEIRVIFNQHSEVADRLPLFASLEKPILPKTLVKREHDHTGPPYLPPALDG